MIIIYLWYAIFRVAFLCLYVADTAFIHCLKMTYWTNEDSHPGNAFALSMGHDHPIKKWIENGNIFLQYPAVHPTNTGFNHPVTRWDNHRQKFPYVGRFGDFVRVRDLPTTIRLKSVADHFGALGLIAGRGTIICGSPGEISNDRSIDSLFDFTTGVNQPLSSTGGDRRDVWVTIAMRARDQLRQRVAWALSQILVVVPDAFNNGRDHPEWFVNFYDIFVTNAFGNYRDILREISYSPMMAQNLSFLQSKSASYIRKRYHYRAYADENFAREIMVRIQ